MIDLANTRDAYGQSLFSGFKTDADAFVRNLDGTVSYNGDRGIHTVQVSENVNVSTAVDGESVFGRVQTAGGPKSVFEVVEGLMYRVQHFHFENVP